MKPLSPGLSTPREEPSKWPSIEHKGRWTVLEDWDADQYTALRRTLLNHDTHGDHLAQQILWLYHSGLNLPMKSLNDHRLLYEAIKNHDANMRDMYPSAPKTWVKEFSDVSVAACYAGHLEHILGVEA